jgi:2,3,4,5-tetrahydropyridine-2-carboxylate N-succinyltransferase
MRRRSQATLRQLTGREVSIGGFDLRLLPPAFIVKNVRVANDGRGLAGDCFSAAEIEVRGVPELQTDRIDIRRIRLISPRIVFEVFEDGTHNFSSILAALPRSDDSGGLDVRLGEAVLQNATVRFREWKAQLDVVLRGTVLTARSQWLSKVTTASLACRRARFRLEDNRVMEGGATRYYDKVSSKFESFDFAAAGIRVVPPAMARRGSYLAKNVVLMPSYVNIGAYVDEGTMVDTWATVGSCAQIGKNVHLSGGVGIGGVLEPVQAGPVIIEDNCFIGARSEVVEGVIVEENSVLSMGVFIGQSTKILDRATGEVLYGRVPAGSVVVAGTLPSADGRYGLYCAVIVKRVDARTRAKTSLNELLRGD